VHFSNPRKEKKRKEGEKEERKGREKSKDKRGRKEKSKEGELLSNSHFWLRH